MFLELLKKKKREEDKNILEQDKVFKVVMMVTAINRKLSKKILICTDNHYQFFQNRPKTKMRMKTNDQLM